MKATTIALAAAVIVATVATAPVGAQADQDQGPIDALLDSADGDLLTQLRAFAGGVFARLTGSSEERTDSEAAADLRTEFNRHNTSIEGWVNNRTTASTEANVLRLRLDADDDGSVATIYLVADVTGGDYANATMVNATSRSIDESCTLEDDAARNAADELDQFQADVVADDEDVPPDLRPRLAGQYSGQVDCTFPLREGA